MDGGDTGLAPMSRLSRFEALPIFTVPAPSGITLRCSIGVSCQKLLLSYWSFPAA